MAAVSGWPIRHNRYHRFMNNPPDVTDPHPPVPTPEGEPSPDATALTSRHLIGGLIIVAIMWAALILPAKFATQTSLHFMSLWLGALGGTVGFCVWWMTRRRVPSGPRSRFLVVTVLGVLVTLMVCHRSVRLYFLMHGIPLMITALAVAIPVLLPRLRRPRLGLSILGVGIGAYLAAACSVRTDLDAEFSARGFEPRWSRSDEQRLVASLRSSEGPDDEPAVAPEFEIPRGSPGPADWAEFRGPSRDGVVRGLSEMNFGENGLPAERWRRPVGPGWSSMIVVGDLVVTQEQREDVEAVTAYHIDDGRPLWANETEGRFTASMGGVGPRATPTFADGSIFAVGANGRVQRIDPSTGSRLWAFDLITDHGARLPSWGFASSPLVTDGRVHVFSGKPGESLVTLDAATGRLDWSNGSGTHSYSSPHSATLAGVRQILMASNWGLESFTPDGEALWSHRWDIGDMARVTQPLVVGDAVYVGTGYGNGTRRLDVARTDAGWKVTEAWTARLKPYFNDMVHHAGTIYGFDGPILMAIDAETGDKRWKRGRYGHGQMLLLPDADELLIVAEDGRLVRVAADPEKFRERSIAPAIEGRAWNHPVIAGDRLLMRTDREMVCFDLRPDRSRRTSITRVAR